MSYMIIIDVVEALPEAVVGQVLTSWVDLKDIARLDSSLCNHKRRNTFLNIVYSAEFTYSEEIGLEKLNYFSQSYNIRCDRLMDWVFLRKVGVNFMFVSNYVNKNAALRKQYLSQHGSKLNSIIFNYFPTQEHRPENVTAVLEDFYEFCHNINNFQVSINRFDNTDFCEVVTTWPGLRKIALNNFANDRTIDLVATTCKHLREIKSVCCHTITVQGWIKFLTTCNHELTCINMGDVLFTEDMYMIVASRFTKLRKLSVLASSLTDNILKGIVHNCPDLEIFECIGGREQITDDSVTYLSQSCRNKLIELDLFSSFMVSNI